ncbi:uncharacterized protein LOC133862230 isoform X1 [Alnus glutinosa]|uniref:uncharacterized protein LOC133862230 isoform X1 n=1 Tax=Alnus glutinosa TaxID=3517 RepID=UPI002D76EB01|nr:uncharacterized protein LOC133862230 isoform X1 [Alnus glutinosa]
MMEGFSLKNINLICFNLLLLLTLFSCNLTQLMSDPNPIEAAVCAMIKCGQGTCKPSNASIIGFDCECDPGWKEIQIGPLTFPSCVVPNCTLDFQCGNGSPPPPPPPAPLLPPLPTLFPNLTDPCALVWCGDGTCMTNGTGYACNCNEGSANLMNLTGFACFKECYFGADCKGSATTQPSTSSSSRNDITNGGSSEVPNFLRSFHTLHTVMLAVIFITWI